jgi:cytochrome c-type biogenesis protein CcmH/NrfG
MAARWLRCLAAAPLMLSSLVLTAPQPARALVPYVLVPSPGSLEGAGVGIAQAAARLLRMGQAEEAAELAALTVQLIPEDPRGWVLLAEAQLRSGHDKEAGKALEKARSLDPRNPGILFAQGSLALKANEPAKGAELIRQGLKLDDQNAGAYFDLGNAHILMGRSGEALAHFERASALRKDFWEAINNQALVLFEQGKTGEAINRWRRVLKISPKASEPMLALAAALNGEKPGNSESVELAHEALAAEPNYVLASYQKEQLWGNRLRAATATLLAQPVLKADVERAQANAGGSADDGE